MRPPTPPCPPKCPPKCQIPLPRRSITSLGFACVGDVEEHPILGTLEAAKGWLHATYPTAWVTSSVPGVSSLRHAVTYDGLDLGKVRGPDGFVCTTSAEQHLAYKFLREQGYQVVLKPADGLGCQGLVLDASKSDLAPITSGEIAPCIVEEMVGAKNGPSPTIYMCGEHVLMIADQLMKDGTNEGNVAPSTISSKLQSEIAKAGKALGRYLGLTSQWGMDFVMNPVTGDPIIVDLNLGRPNGSLANYMWASRQPRPQDASSAFLQQYALMRKSPTGETLEDFNRLLETSGLLWTEGCLEGIVPFSHVPNGRHSVLCVSWHSLNSARALARKLQDIDHAATYSMTAPVHAALPCVDSPPPPSPRPATSPSSASTPRPSTPRPSTSRPSAPRPSAPRPSAARLVAASYPEASNKAWRLHVRPRPYTPRPTTPPPAAPSAATSAEP